MYDFIIGTRSGKICGDSLPLNTKGASDGKMIRIVQKKDNKKKKDKMKKKSEKLN